MSIEAIIILIIILLFIIICAISYLKTKIFQPTIIDKDIKYNYDEVNIKTKDGEILNGILIKPNKDKPLIVYYHGNTGSINNRKYIINTCLDLDVGLFLIDYRGYGKSTGKPSTRSIKYDALTCYDYIKKLYNESRILIWGESIGGGPATYVAMKRNPSSLMLLATYSSLDKVLVSMKSQHPIIIKLLAANLVANTMDNLPIENWLSKVNCPVIIVHSIDDELIRIQHAKDNIEKLRYYKKDYIFIQITGGHSSPIIPVSKLKLLLKKCNIDYSKITSRGLAKISERLRLAGEET